MKSIARLNFAHLPTPIEELPRLTKALGGPRILVKRDDQTGLAFGGNKTRKLEFLVAEAREQGADMLISAGAIQSNHCRQTVAAAARFGFDCTLVLTGERPAQPSANFLLDQLFGAEIITVADRKDRDRVLQETFDNAVAAGKKPYLVPYGGSSVTGAMGYTFAMEELMKQNCRSRGDLDRLRHILRRHARGTCARSAGVWISKAKCWESALTSLWRNSRRMFPRLLHKPAKNSASGSSSQAMMFWQMKIIVRQVMESLEKANAKRSNYLPATKDLLLDPVYTGRAAAGMIDLIRKGFFKKDETVLFWHTGGQPALFADKYSGDVVRSK